MLPDAPRAAREAGLGDTVTCLSELQARDPLAWEDLRMDLLGAGCAMGAFDSVPRWLQGWRRGARRPADNGMRTG